jgi:hypothetical protein
MKGIGCILYIDADQVVARAVTEISCVTLYLYKSDNKMDIDNMRVFCCSLDKHRHQDNLGS